jgi:hypothetical protein
MNAGLNHKAGASPNACFASLTSPYSQLGYYHNEYFRVKLERREIKFPELLLGYHKAINKAVRDCYRFVNRYPLVERIPLN